MADPPAKSDEAPVKKRGGMLFTLLLATVAVGCGGLGFAIPLLFPKWFEKGDTQPVKASAANPQFPAFVSFGEVVVNLNSDRFNRYLRVTITLQVSSHKKEQLAKRLEEQRVVLKNWLLSYLSDHEMDQIRGAAGQNRLRREIQDQFNAILFPDGFDLIEDVLFEEFSVQ